MTIGIKLPISDDNSEDGFFIYFDSVTTYTRSIKGSVTKNPTARGPAITDNFISENPTFGFSAVVSFADISSVYSLIRDDQQNIANNAIDQPIAATVDPNTGGLLNFLPESIGQFLPNFQQGVTVDGARTNYKDYVEACLDRLMTGEVYNTKTRRTETRIRPIKLFEFQGVELTKIYDDICLISKDVRETVDSGNALFCDLQFEKVKFVKLGTTQISPDVVKAMKTKAAPKAKKGNVTKVNEEEDIKDDLSGVP